MTSLLQATSPLEKWLCYIEQSHSKIIDMGLERVKRVATQLDLLQPAPFVITVGGTNGKGTTCHLLEMLLLNAGYRVGVYSSPHLLRYNERVRIQNQELPDSAHSESFYFLDQHKSESLSYFEFSTLSALQLFKQAKLDVVILEVGLGGRLDATNIVDADISVITSIDIDHVDYLGDSREQIGYEKAGIFRSGKRAVIGEPNIPNSVIQYAQQIGCQLFCRDQDWCYQQTDQHWQWQNNINSESAVWQNLPLPQIPLANAATALAVCARLPFKITLENITKTLSEVELNGRFQTIKPEQLQQWLAKRRQKSQTLNDLKLENLPQVIVDVGHNPHAARYLAQKLQLLKSQPERKITAVFAMLKDKDAGHVVEPLAELIDQWYFAGLDCYRGQSAEQLQSAVQAYLPESTIQKAKTALNVTTAVETAITEMSAQETLLIFGSFFTVAEFLVLISE